MTCFTPGTAIATQGGPCLIVDLQVGDGVITRDHGIRTIRWIGSRRLDYGQLADNPHLKPVIFTKGCFGRGQPDRNMLLSPNHRLLVKNERTMLPFEEHEALVSAKHLENSHSVRTVQTLGVTYIMLTFDRHEVVHADGCWVECFQPEDQSLNGLGNAQRNEAFELFPELSEAFARRRNRPSNGILRRTEVVVHRP